MTRDEYHGYKKMLQFITAAASATAELPARE